MTESIGSKSLATRAKEWLLEDVPLGTAVKDVADLSAAAAIGASTIPAWTLFASILGVGYVVGSVVNALDLAPQPAEPTPPDRPA